MFVGRGVGLGLGGMNLTDLRKKLNAGVPSVQYCRRQGGEDRRYSCGAKQRANSCFYGFSSSRAKKEKLVQTICGRSQERSQNGVARQMERKKRFPTRKREQQQQLQQQKDNEEQAKTIAMKKAFNRRTFWIACRAVAIGILLVLLGAAMCTIGYYNEYFAMETTHVAENVTMTAPNPTRKFQFQSLTYIGPVVMGAGAFILMMACVTTLESRDRQARLYREQQAQLDAEKTPLSRKGTLTKRVPIPSAVPGPSALKSSTSYGSKLGDKSSTDAERASIRKMEPTNKPTDAKLIPYQPVDLVSVPVNANPKIGGGGGAANRCFMRDDSKTASKPDTDSGPSGTTTTTLTWSKNGGPRCETDVVCKYPSTSCIDNLVRKAPDERALLQRFLEDQSRLVENRINRRIQNPQREGDDAFRSSSMDAPESEKVVNSTRNARSEEIPSRRSVVAAEVHHAGDASPDFQRNSNAVDVSKPQLQHSVPTCSRFAFSTDKVELATPEAANDKLELFSPSPNSSSHQSKTQFAVHERSGSPDFNADRSISSSYVTVTDGEEIGSTIDLFNANVRSTPNVCVPSQIRSGEPHATDPTSRKLYDSVFLAENLRLKAVDKKEQTGLAEISSMDQLMPKKLSNLSNRIDYRQRVTDQNLEKKETDDQTGGLCKDLKEMNANYLS